MTDLVKMVRRSDLELVEEIINYLKTKKGIVTQGQLCSSVNINSETADKWLKILYLIKNDCPKFQFGKAGKYGLISIVDFDDLQAELLSRLTEEESGLIKTDKTELRHQTTPASSITEDDNTGKFSAAIKAKNFELGDLRTDLLGRLSEESAGLKRIADKDYKTMIVVSEKVKPILRCNECGEKRGYPSHCGEPMEFEGNYFVCTFKDRCGTRIAIPIHCGKPMSVVITESL